LSATRHLLSFDTTSHRWRLQYSFGLLSAGLRGMTFSASAHSPTLIVYGAKLLLSVDHGDAFHTLALPLVETQHSIVAVATSGFGELAMLFEDSGVLIVRLGQVEVEGIGPDGSPTQYLRPLLQIPPPKSSADLAPLTTTRVALWFSSATNSLDALQIVCNSTCEPLRSILAWQREWAQPIALPSSQDAGGCTDTAQSLGRGYEADNMLVGRLAWGGGTGSCGSNIPDLPARLFFDWHDEFNFLVRVPVRFNARSWDAMFFQLDGGESSSIVMNVAATASASQIEYRVRLSEYRVQVSTEHKRNSGERLELVTLQIVYPSQVGCSSEYRKSAAVALYVGCPPNRSVSYDADVSYHSLEHGCDADELVPCVWAGHDFYPVFQLDGVGGARNIYNGSFRLTIVAGGRQLDSMRIYSATEQAAYSMWATNAELRGAGGDSSPVFGFLQEAQMQSPTRSGACSRLQHQETIVGHISVPTSRSLCKSR
jgi:hypothetical protein